MQDASISILSVPMWVLSWLFSASSSTVGSRSTSPGEHVVANGETRRFWEQNIEGYFERGPPAMARKKTCGRRHVLARGRPRDRVTTRETSDRHPISRIHADPSFLEVVFWLVLVISPGSSHPWLNIEAEQEEERRETYLAVKDEMGSTAPLF